MATELLHGSLSMQRNGSFANAYPYIYVHVAYADAKRWYNEVSMVYENF